MSKTIIYILIILVLLTSILLAQHETEADTVIAGEIGWMAYPYAFYTPETQLAFGVGGLMYFRTTTSQIIRPSKILLSGYYTTNKQYYIKLAPVVYFPGRDQESLELKVIYAKEILKFYGIGNDTPEIENPDYTMKYWRFYIEYTGFPLFMEGLSFGLLFDYSPNDMADKQSNPFLLEGDIAGHDGGVVSGLGFLATYDSRDNIFFPTNNIFYKFRVQYFNKALGGEFEYGRFVFDLRHYASIGTGHILAWQVYGDITTKEPPFFRLPALGGDQRMRGYFYGRFRDRLYLTNQLEYRKIVWWRLGFAAFVGMGDVADKFKTFNTKTIKFSYGFGLRFVFDEEEGINLRMDLGFGKNTNGIYFAMEEAF
jgi:hypothetical protein